MAYTPHTLVTIGGRLSEVGTHDEIWQVGMRGGNPTTSWHPMDVAEHGPYLDDFSTGTLNIQDWFIAPSCYISPDATLDWAKIVNIGADGAYTSDPTIHLFSGVNGGSLDAGKLPSFCSVCLSWETDAPGRTNRRGRVYPPNFGLGVEAGAHIAPAVVATLLTSALSFVATFNREGDGYKFEPAVVSPSGGHAAITRVRVGNVVDVQRRRKNAVPETYQSADYPS